MPLKPWERRNRLEQRVKDHAGTTYDGGLACKHCGCVEFEHNTLKGENRRCHVHPTCPGYEAQMAKEISR